MNGKSREKEEFSRLSCKAGPGNGSRFEGSGSLLGIGKKKDKDDIDGRKDQQEEKEDSRRERKNLMDDFVLRFGRLIEIKGQRLKHLLRGEEKDAPDDSDGGTDTSDDPIRVSDQKCHDSDEEEDNADDDEDIQSQRRRRDSGRLESLGDIRTGLSVRRHRHAVHDHLSVAVDLHVRSFKEKRRQIQQDDDRILYGRAVRLNGRMGVLISPLKREKGKDKEQKQQRSRNRINESPDPGHRYLPQQKDTGNSRREQLTPVLTFPRKKDEWQVPVFL